MVSSVQNFELVIIGGGPGGIATLLAAHKNDQLDCLLSRGVAIVESSGQLGTGTIGNYVINSDSGGATFVDCLDSAHPTELTQLQKHEVTKRLSAAGQGSVPLRDAGQFLGLAGDALAKMIKTYPSSEVFTQHKAQSARRCADGWRLELFDLKSKETRSVVARQVIIATGAHQPPQRLASEYFGDQSLASRCSGRLMQSGDVLTQTGLRGISEALAFKSNPRVAIIGGSTSAAAVAHALLHRLAGVTFGAGGITILHRRPLRIYYPDRASALADGYTEWSEDDVCQLSGKVFRFAGFRLDSRELIMQVRGIGDRPIESRVQLHQLTSDDREAERILDEADIVISAMGYRPRGLPIFDESGFPITLYSQTGSQRPMVDDACRILDVDGKTLPNLYGIGLAAGFVPRGALGGEASFRGQANGLWLWQHDVGALIVQAVLQKSVSKSNKTEISLPVFAAPRRDSCGIPTIVQG